MGQNHPKVKRLIMFGKIRGLNIIIPMDIKY